MKGLVFDKDGTLFDFNATWGPYAKQLLIELARDDDHLAALAALMGVKIDEERFTAESVFIAETAKVWTALLVPHLDISQDTLFALVSEKAKAVPQVPVTDLFPYLSGLRDQGYVLGIATNDTEGPARAHLAAHGILDLFDFIAGADSGYGAKPEAGQLAAFCERTGLAAKDCVMIGDSLHDLHAGQKAGMTPVAVLTGPMPRHVLAPHAATVLETIVDLPDWLSSSRPCTRPE
ncbi:HAD family hydrolase [Marivivens sp. LCG002]|uniref:HAD family hydrolase n=1 Tax=Marivivens sp. LCG002 TaxID=3051171 RepID=UPI0025529337|nr:HAD family hydrolase [Marivivens sp. LCG002]WIV51511.1 HAD family hydrolase [Marivivens sp. LCG002]